MKCPNCKKSLWFVRSFCPFCSTNINAPPRPKSVTVLCWCLIGSGISLVFLSFVDTELQSYLERLGSVHPAQRVFFFVGPVLCLVLGGFTLFGHNWARWSLVTWLGVNVLISVVNQSAMHLIFLRVLLAAATAYYLLRPQSRAFFRSEGTAITSTQNVSWPAGHSNSESPRE